MDLKQTTKELSLTQSELKLLRKLQADGRISNADLAREANMSPATCFRRTQRLFEDGYIKSIRAQIDPEKVGRGSLIFVGVVLDRSTPESFRSEEHTSELQSLMRNSYAVFCLKKIKKKKNIQQ